MRFRRNLRAGDEACGIQASYAQIAETLGLTTEADLETLLVFASLLMKLSVLEPCGNRTS